MSLALTHLLLGLGETRSVVEGTSLPSTDPTFDGHGKNDPGSSPGLKPPEQVRSRPSCPPTPFPPTWHDVAFRTALQS